MSSVRVTFIGRKRFERRMKTAPRRFRKNLRERVEQAAGLIERGAKKAMRGSRTRARRKGRPVTAPPNVLGIDTGRLRQSITSDVRVAGKRFYAEIGPQRVVYARIHEMGGIAGRGVRIPQRPYLAPAIKKNEKKVISLIGRSFRVV